MRDRSFPECPLLHNKPQHRKELRLSLLTHKPYEQPLQSEEAAVKLLKARQVRPALQPRQLHSRPKQPNREIHQRCYHPYRSAHRMEQRILQ